MKKLIDVADKSLLLLIAAFGVLYLYWFYSFPIDEPFYFVPFLYAALVIAFVLTKILIKHKFLFSLLLIFALLILTANTFYSINYFPRMIDTAKYKDTRYFIASTKDLDFHSFMLFYKCNKWVFNCSSLYGAYSWERSIHILVDETRNEVSILQGETLQRFIYTDGNNPRDYEGYPTKLGEHIYQLSTKNKFVTCELSVCEFYIYTLYKCKLDYTACDSLPIHYTTDFEYFTYLKANEITNEIKVFDSSDDTLIFVWGEHPRCHVEGCEILEK